MRHAREASLRRPLLERFAASLRAEVAREATTGLA